MIATHEGIVGSPNAPREVAAAPPVPKMRRLLVDGWVGVAFTTLGLSVAPTLVETSAWRNAGWVLVFVPLLVGFAGLLTSVHANRRARLTLGSWVVTARDSAGVRRQVHTAYALVPCLIALVAMTVDGIRGPRIADGAEVLWLLVAVLMLSPAGVWTVMLDGATVVVGLLRVGSVLVAAVPVSTVGFVAGYLGFILGSVLFEPDLLAWSMASILGMTVGYTLSILPLHLLVLPRYR